MNEDHFFFALVLTVIAATGVLMFLSVRASSREAQEWEEFAKHHACKVVARKKETVSTGVGPVVGGKDAGVAFIVNTTPAQTAYLCDDGVTYWRNGGTP